MTKKLTKITEEEKTALKATGYKHLGDSLKDLSEVFVNTSIEELADDYLDDFVHETLEETYIETKYNDYKKHLETIICMIERLTGLTYGYTFIGEEEDFDKLKTIKINKK